MAGHPQERETPRRRGRPPRTAAQRAEQRARLVDGAIEAIRAGGPDQSIDDLAAAIGVSKPVLYDEFGGRLGLADAIAVLLAGQVERAVLGALGASAVDVDAVLHAIVDTLVSLIEADPEPTAFITRTLRTEERRFLDNALVRVLHERAAVLVGSLVPDVPDETVQLLTDGVYGFVWAMVESWQENRTTSRDQLVALLSSVIRGGLRAAADE